MTSYCIITVAGTDYEEALDLRVKSATGENNSSSSFEATFDNFNGRHKSSFNINDDVQIKIDKNINPPTTLVFRGIIEDIKFRSKGSVEETVFISGRDYSARMQDATIEPEIYNNQEISVIVKDIMDKYVGSSITVSNVATTSTTITRIVFKHINVFDAVQQLADLSDDFIFYVDTTKDLHFEKRSSTPSGYILDSNNVLAADFRTSDDDIFNNIWVYGDRTLVGYQENFVGNGAGSVYTLVYKPYSTEIRVGSPWYSQTPLSGGLFESITPGVFPPYQYLVNFESKQVIFTSGADQNNIPNGSFFVFYQRSVPIAEFGINRASEAAYGKKGLAIMDKNITSVSAAVDIVTQKIEQFSDPKVQGKLKIDGISVLLAGQSVIVNLPNQNISNQTYEILEVNYEVDQVTLLSDTILSVRVSKKIKDITDTLKQILNELRRTQADAIISEDVITRLETMTGSLGLRWHWDVYTRAINDSMIWGHLTPANGHWGVAKWGDRRSAKALSISGGDF